METTQISINTELYNHAADYARSHNTSVEKMMESYIVALLTFMQTEDHTPDFVDYAVIENGVLQVTPDLQKEIEDKKGQKL